MGRKRKEPEVFSSRPLNNHDLPEGKNDVEKYRPGSPFPVRTLFFFTRR